VSAEECQAEKIEALGALRSCRASARAIQVEGGSADAGACDRAFEVALGAASTKVTGSDVPCRFWDGGDGTVLDLHTGLVWGQATPTAAAPWSEAMSDLVAGEVGASDDGVQLVGCRADRCDWRPPTVAELSTVIDEAPCDLAVTGDVFGTKPCIPPILGYTQVARYWSATFLGPSTPRRAWTIDFAYAEVRPDPPETAHFVRPVRGGLEDWPSTPPPNGGACQAAKLRAIGDVRACRAAARARALRGGTADLPACDAAFAGALATAERLAVGPPCRFLDNGDDTVTDLDTGLTWERKTPATVGNTDDWPGAMSTYLSALNGISDSVFAMGQSLAGHHDWRLPSVTELAAIVDRSASGCRTGGPCIDPAFGPTGVTLPYWTATRRTGDGTGVWAVSFGDAAGVFEQRRDISGVVRAVRGGLD